VRVIGVIDLARGCAVHARGGRREQYAAVPSVAGTPIDPGSTVTIATFYLERLGLSELYVADLDAILGGPSQGAAIGEIAALGAPLWLDAGVRTVDDVQRAFDCGASTAIVGLETLPSFAVLDEICAAAGRDRVALSLDLREGRSIGPLVPLGDGLPPPLMLRRTAEALAKAGEAVPERLAARAAEAGVGALIVLDLARVGTGRGLDVDLVGRIRRTVPDVTLLAGGGVAGLSDLAGLAAAGCDGALVGTALHDGRIGRGEIAAARRFEARYPPAFTR
jgi:phosphoribosylformimino-5-aminoimidazole carboxamide ribotide isomerase